MKYVISIFIFVLFASSVFAQFPLVWDDSTYLALRYEGELQVPQSTIDRIEAERALITNAFPVVSHIWVFREWDPGVAECGLTEEAWADFNAGGLQELRNIAAQHQCFFWNPSSSLNSLEIRSMLPLNSERLAELFAGVEGVRYCYAYKSLCCDGPTIEVLDLGLTSRYLYRYAWGDCLMGCQASHYWQFLVSGGEVSLEAEWGVVSDETQSWGSVKALFR